MACFLRNVIIAGKRARGFPVYDKLHGVVV